MLPLYWVQSENWLSFHIFYHTGDRSELAVRFIYPTVVDLLRNGSIEAFFFVRYSLGGPHVRLRLLPRSNKRDVVHDFVKRRSEQFLNAYPSPRALANEEIQRQNIRLLSQDPNEHDDATYPDNSCHEAPFRPEVERYGGRDLLVHSLLFFAVSSSRTLELLANHFKSEASEWLVIALGLLRRFALGFAADVDELQALTVIPLVANTEITARIVAKADQVFERNREPFLQLFYQDIERLSIARPCFDDLESAICLSQELQGSVTRHRILTSHIHMTANRLGLKNSDEIYLMRILERSIAEIKASKPRYWVQLERALARRITIDGTATARLCDLLHPILGNILALSKY